MSELRMKITSKSRSQFVTELLQSVTWSGSIGCVARTLDYSLIYNQQADGYNGYPCGVGDYVQLWDGDTLLFYGVNVRRTRNGAGNSIALVAYDLGFYLKRCKVYQPVRSQTPEAVTKALCAGYGIEVGDIAATGVKLTRNFMGVSLYNLIATLYTLASASTGSKYLVGMEGRRLCVRKRSRGSAAAALHTGVDLRTSNAVESIQNTVNRVLVYSDEYAVMGTYQDAESVSAYGVLQDAIKGSAYDDAAAEAKRRLADSPFEQTITVEVDGDPALITGQAVTLTDAATGITGYFFIDSDTHVWRNGDYTTKLTLNFDMIMDEQSAGSEVT